jgi:hypothetical protein
MITDHSVFLPQERILYGVLDFLVTRVFEAEYQEVRFSVMPFVSLHAN